MSNLKPTAAKSPADYIKQIDEPRRGEIAQLDKFIRKTVPSLKPFLSEGTVPMLGYGPYHYKYASGREGDTAIVSLASQKHHISVYVFCVDEAIGKYVAEKHADDLGKVSVGKSCIRFKRIDDLNLDALAEVLREAALTMGQSPDSAP
jgi:hypothetical protein